MAQRKKKAIEYHFVDMNDPDRYKKLKVARACDFCRRRKSKCDIGIPGSGTCSNCKKANNICIFSPVSGTTSSSGANTNKGSSPISMVSSSSAASAAASGGSIVKKHCHSHQQQCLIQQSQQQKPQKLINNSNNNNSFTTVYQDQFPLFSMDQKAHCGYERDNNIYSHVTLASTTQRTLTGDIPIYSKQIEQELFDTYFIYVHPFFPILDRYYILQSLRFDNNAIPCPLKWAVMAIALSHFSNRLEDSNHIATIYYQHAIHQLDHSNFSLATVQTLFLLYKYQEMMTPVGQPMNNLTIGYLKEAQAILQQLKQQQRTAEQWTTNDEFICRLEWILFIILSTNNISDKRWKNMLEYSTAPNKLPSLTETEQYDKIELNTTCNLIHLINITLLYSQTISFVSDSSTLFSLSPKEGSEQQFNKLATGLKVWKNTLPTHMASQLNASSASADFDTTTTKLTSFTTYLCFLYDILDLLVSIHESNEQHSLSKKALSVCIRAHTFTIGDIHPPHFSRLASIQGSRLVSFALCLALQTQSYYQQQMQLAPTENFYSCCSLTFEVLNQVPLSPQLYMTIQTFHTQIESKKQLQQQQQHYEQPPYGLPDSSTATSSNSSSTQSFHTTPSSAPSSSVIMDSSSYYFSHAHDQQRGNSGVWQQQQQYPSYNSDNSSSHHQIDTAWNNSNNYYRSPPAPFTMQQQQEDMPITPTCEDNISFYEQSSNTSPLIAPVDSYFQPYPQQPVNFTVMVSSGPYNHSFERFCDSKSCKNKKMI